MIGRPTARPTVTEKVVPLDGYQAKVRIFDYSDGGQLYWCNLLNSSGVYIGTFITSNFDHSDLEECARRHQETGTILS